MTVNPLRPILLTVTAALALAFAPAAIADTSQSTNWAGYAVHHAGVHFKKVLGTWTQPTATCTPGQPTYSSVWVGIGGYSLTSPALEQIGTEADCTASGTETSSAWFELVPAASQTIRLPVSAGDRIRASVAVAGRQVTLSLTDLSQHRSFSRRVRASVVDDTSAEWIVEAPSACSSANACQTLPLADFGSTSFTSATTQTTSGYSGTIDSRRWDTTKITLAEGGRRFITTGGPGAPFATATPSGLADRDTAFTVTYRGFAGGVPTTEARQVATSRLVHAAPLLRRS